MKTNLQLNKIQKFVIVETEKGTLLWGDPDVEFHKDIVKKMEESGVVVIDVKGGGKIKVDENNIYVWGKSSVYGDVVFGEVLSLLKQDFPNHTVLNREPNK